MTQSFLPLGTPEEFQALRDIKVGRTVATAMQERLTLLKLAEHKLGGITLTNAGEVRLAQQRARGPERFRGRCLSVERQTQGFFYR